MAILIPYRNRDRELRVLLHHLHPILQRQQLSYGIFVIEQVNHFFNIFDREQSDNYEKIFKNEYFALKHFQKL